MKLITIGIGTKKNCRKRFGVIIKLHLTIRNHTEKMQDLTSFSDVHLETRNIRKKLMYAVI